MKNVLGFFFFYVVGMLIFVSGIKCTEWLFIMNSEELLDDDDKNFLNNYLNVSGIVQGLKLLLLISSIFWWGFYIIWQFNPFTDY